MIVVKNKADYISRKLAGEDVTSIATCYGYYALSTKIPSKEFSVLVLDFNDYSYYEYALEHGKFCVKSDRELVPHAFTNVVASKMLRDDSLLRWWNCVFFEREGKRHYDNSYDDLYIAEQCNIKFKEVIRELSLLIKTIQFPNSKTQVFIAGELADNPLVQYVLQQHVAFGKLLVLPRVCIDFSFEEHEVVILPKRKLGKLSLGTDLKIHPEDLLLTSMSVSLPLDSSIDSLMLNKVKWKDVLMDEQKDYSMGNMDIKIISLHLECDSFQNIFLGCKDLKGNKKVIQVN